MYIAGIGQAVLELLSFKVGSKGNLLTSEIVGKLQLYEAHFTENDVTSDKSQFPNINKLKYFLSHVRHKLVA